MRPRNLVFITLLALCHAIVNAQTLTDAAPPSQNANPPVANDNGGGLQLSQSDLPDDPGQEILPVAQPEPQPATGTPVDWEAQHQQWAGDTVTLSGNVVFHYRDYVLRADKVTYNRATTEMEAEGHLQVAGGPNDVLINASHGDMRLDMHTARFYDVNGSQGIRNSGRSVVYSTTNPMLFSARVAIQMGEGYYRLVDGTLTNCRLPHPDWRIVARSIALENGEASTKSSFFELLGAPIFYLPYLRHGTQDESRESGLLIPVISNGSSIRGYTFGEQVYWAINRSMDMVLGVEYFSRRGWAPSGDFRYKGPGLDRMQVRWNALDDRGVKQTTSTGTQLVNQGGVDIALSGSVDLSDETRAGGIAEYLSSYVYRLVFDDNYQQAISSQVSSDIALTHAHNGLVPSVGFERFETFASTSNGNEVRVMHLPNIRYDVIDRPLGSHAYWGLGSSLGYLSRSEPNFHARNVGRVDVFPHLTVPFALDGWTFTAEGALRATAYTISQLPDLIPHTGDLPTISHDPLNRLAGEASLDIRPPAMERDFSVGKEWVLRHVIEPELMYRFVGGIGAQERNVLLFDTTDILTDTNEGEYSLMQRFYVRRRDAKPCAPEDTNCKPASREWASWQIAQKAFIDPAFGGALFRGRRNVFETTLDLSSVAFLTSPRNISPVISRMRFEAINNLRIEWDLDYDSKRGLLSSDNLYAGYSIGRTTMGVGHALLNAVDENTGTPDRILKSQIVTPFLEIGKPTQEGFNLAIHGGYDFDLNTLQYAGAQATYNWNCCGLTVGYRRFELGAAGTEIRDETQFLYSFTLASFGNVGDIRRANTVFRDPTLPPVY
jgi:LPS-assembly protein